MGIRLASKLTLSHKLQHNCALSYTLKQKERYYPLNSLIVSNVFLSFLIKIKYKM